MARKRRFWRRSTVRRTTLAGLALTLAALGSTRTAQSMVGALLQDASAILDGRSPGERDPGALFQTKPPLRSAAPRQRVLSNTRVRPPGAEAAVPPGGDAGAIPVGDGAVPLVGADGGQAAGAGPESVPFGSAEPSAAGAQPIVLPNAEATPTPVSAIPEPDTYALLAIGIGMIGAAQRRSRRKRRDRATDLRSRLKTGLSEQP